MKAVIHEGAPGWDGLRFADVAESSMAAGHVKVRLHAAGLNHRDLFVLFRHQPQDPPVILGSDGAGVVEEVAEDVNSVTPGDEVVIIPSLGWQKKSSAPPEGFEILGFPDHGTWAEKIVVPQENVVARPRHLSREEAGVFPLAALTAYRALFTQGEVRPGQTVFIPGAGSGVTTLLIQMAKSAGARVVTSSRSEQKRSKAEKLGADLVLANDEDWNKALAGETVDLVIESVGAATFHRSLNVLRRGGTMVVFGASAGDEISLNLRQFFYGQYRLIGSTMGSCEEFREMVKFSEQHEIRPVVDAVYPLFEAKHALKRLEAAEQFGKIALRIDES